MKILWILILGVLIHAEQYAVVISKECTIDTKLDLQKIYLKKQRNINSCRIVPLNLSAQSPIRQYFVQAILQIDDKHWNRYWDKMHFKGIKAPHVVVSAQSMSAYVVNVPGSIGYIPDTLVSQEMTIISHFERK